MTVACQRAPNTRPFAGFLALLEERGQLRRITGPVWISESVSSPAIVPTGCGRGGPGLLF